MQLAMYHVSPFGERRADLRAAFHTANQIAAQSPSKISEPDFMAMREHLSVYMQCDAPQDPDEMEVDPEALRRIKEIK